MGGIVASVTTAMAVAGCKIVEMTGQRHTDSLDDSRGLKFTFFLEKGDGPVDDDELEEFARSIMAACNNPHRIHSLHSTNEALRKENNELRAQLRSLEARWESHFIKITKKSQALTEGPPTKQS